MEKSLEVAEKATMAWSLAFMSKLYWLIVRAYEETTIEDRCYMTVIVVAKAVQMRDAHIWAFSLQPGICSHLTCQLLVYRSWICFLAEFVRHTAAKNELSVKASRLDRDRYAHVEPASNVFALVADIASVVIIEPQMTFDDGHIGISVVP